MQHGFSSLPSLFLPYFCYFIPKFIEKREFDEIPSEVSPPKTKRREGDTKEQVWYCRKGRESFSIFVVESVLEFTLANLPSYKCQFMNTKKLEKIFF